MLITLYKSSLCPRCYLAKKSLQQLAKNYSDMQIEEVDILTSPGLALHAGIRMIPAIRVGDKTLSSIYLSRKKIDEFVTSFIL
ncbi:MAG: glutaredoxin-related protein [Desulforhopalus sp.]|jgi:glutaredoxin-related protein